MRARMPEDRHVDDAITNGALPPSVARAAAALRAAVPVRAEWRASVLAEVARVARDDGMTGPAAIRGGRPPASRGRRWARLTVAWPVAIACGVLVFAAGVLAARVAGGSRSVGESRRPAAATDAPRRGTTRFVLVAPNAQRVALVGDFNLWNPASAPMRRMAGTGEWEIDLPLPAGRHAYAFVVDGDVTADPSAPRTAGDDYGRPNSVVLVSSPRS